jgi:rare lipoprotein A
MLQQLRFLSVHWAILRRDGSRKAPANTIHATIIRGARPFLGNKTLLVEFSKRTLLLKLERQMQRRSAPRIARDILITGLLTFPITESAAAPLHAASIKHQRSLHWIGRNPRHVLRDQLHRFLSIANQKGSEASPSGIASVYSNRSTASGESMDPKGMTTAHRFLPFGTKVKVTNQDNGLSAVVRINDRGPFVRGRVIDLSPAAASALGMDGLASVRIVPMDEDLVDGKGSGTAGAVDQVAVK